MNSSKTHLPVLSGAGKRVAILGMVLTMTACGGLGTVGSDAGCIIFGEELQAIPPVPETPLGDWVAGTVETMTATCTAPPTFWERLFG